MRILLKFLQQIILERTELSSKILNILHKIDHPISYFLLDVYQNSEYNTDISYIDLAEEKGFLSYIPENKDKPTIIKIGRLINALLEKNKDKINFQYKSDDIQKFVALFEGVLKSEQQIFKIVKGNDIAKWYLEKNYAKGGGKSDRLNGTGTNQEGGNCMKSGSCQPFFTVYTKTPSINMVILTDSNNKLIGRALLWKNVYLKDKDMYITFMDKIYTINSNIIDEQFKSFAKKNGWWYCIFQGVTNQNHKDITNGKEIIKNAKLYSWIADLDWKNLMKYRRPYVDTLHYFGYMKDETGKKRPFLSSDPKSPYTETWTDINGFYTEYDPSKDHNFFTDFGDDFYDDIYRESFKYIKTFKEFLKS